MVHIDTMVRTQVYLGEKDLELLDLVVRRFAHTWADADTGLRIAQNTARKIGQPQESVADDVILDTG